MTIRILGARRLSRVTDSSTSFERQAEAIRGAVRAIGGTLLSEWADDPDVSAAKVPPMERPGLGPWLASPQDFDGVAWWRLDRAVRSMGDMADLARWAKTNRKRLIFAEGPGGGRLELDMTSPMSELILIILAFAAEMEVQAIKERVDGTRDYLRSVGRWSGGKVPFGRQPVPHPTLRDDKGQPAGVWLARHAPTAELVDEMVTRVIGGESRYGVAAWLNAEHPGATPSNHRRELRGAEPDPASRWNKEMVAQFLRYPLLRGYMVYKGEPVRDASGEPVLVGEPLVSDSEWRALQAALDGTSRQAAAPRSDAHPLLGVLRCGGCRLNMHQAWGRGKRQYRCSAAGKGLRCEAPTSIQADPVDAYAEREFLRRVGAMEVIEVIEHSAVDHTAEIGELRETLDRLGERVAELGGAGHAADVIIGQMRGRAERLAKLEAEPVIPATVEYRSTGQRYAQRWEDSDAGARLRMMLDAGALCTVGSTVTGSSRDVTKRLRFSIGNEAE